MCGPFPLNQWDKPILLTAIQQPRTGHSHTLQRPGVAQNHTHVVQSPSDTREVNFYPTLLPWNQVAK